MPCPNYFLINSLNELTLPVAKLRIKPNCNDVQCNNLKEYVALCVSVEGYVFYWLSIFNELNYDAKCDLPNTDEVPYLMALQTV